MSNAPLHVALVGNPNAGKTSIFNLLTGMNQKVGNFPGVTMDKISGTFRENGAAANVIDLPGTYSIYPRSMDERVVFDVLSDKNAHDFPDKIVVIADASNLERNLLLFSEIQDLGLPTILVLSMLDVANRSGLNIDLRALEEEFNTTVLTVNGRTGEGIPELKKTLFEDLSGSTELFYDINELSPEIIPVIKDKFALENDYVAYQYAQQTYSKSFLSNDEKKFIADKKVQYNFCDRQFQTTETVERYKIIRDKLTRIVTKTDLESTATRNHKIDKILTHKIYGYLIFFVILFALFQSIFAWAEPFMDYIDFGFAKLSSWAKTYLPAGVLTDLIAEGIIPGLGGVVIFIPQIALLFAFIAILEESGYMARVVFLMDKIMRKFGLNGKSVVPLISGVACAIPAIMAARNIESWKDRIITIFVTPFMSCSARLPVYAILIALVIPNDYVFGILSVQGLALMALYLIGFLGAIFSALLLKKILKMKEQSYFIMELPIYRWPKWKNVWITIFSKSKTFVFEAGKIILAISIILWVLASYGPGEAFDHAEQRVVEQNPTVGIGSQEFDALLSAYKLENSYAGVLGKSIEPCIRPLGYDWKIGIALITSFAAREVFVGTIATIYSVGSDVEDESTIKDKLRAEINPYTGKPMYSIALGVSLMLFYAFAMQCMSTLAVVYRETKSWKWPLLQLIYMSAVAYIFAFIAYQLLK
ncbi:ferrous iron transport protein B [Reichenbachiella carrageenanivorans]|uniref:Ferrous iron transport protein B n=1 Tax=Reichenbachiella carrageenanivorans TaxID=2979869 RepID=A0ABY6D3F4_9BACT|nr:ferrous iron transport protein B [Reichenbachiella carrageenanivorans]UXX80699.1 ferrous iron transport protein B [Reichenbachiella carrageenanivorans]